MGRGRLVECSSMFPLSPQFGETFRHTSFESVLSCCFFDTEATENNRQQSQLIKSRPAMGLALHNPSSFNNHTSGCSPGCGSGPIAGSVHDSDPDLASCNRRRRNPRSAPRRYRLRDTRHHSRKHLTYTQFRKTAHPDLSAPARSTHRTKGSWVTDADEGRALARSGTPLPSDWHRQGQGDGCDPQREARASARAAGGRRPPSLERQDAFRDAATCKRCRRAPPPPSARPLVTAAAAASEAEAGDDAREIDELYRMGLLYDDEHERGEGFSLARLDRREPVYTVRVKPARRARRSPAGDDWARDHVSIAVDLAFSTFAEDEALAAWLIPTSSAVQGQGQGGYASAESRATRPREAAEAAPWLKIIYELDDDAAATRSTATADDFLESVSDISSSSWFGGEERDGELAWAIIEGCNGTREHAAPLTVLSAAVDQASEDDGIDPWVVLGRDGS